MAQQKLRKVPSGRRSASPTEVVNKFPAAWVWFADELIPTWVKTHYSPRESWKSKPFSTEDAHFFFKGIGDLSELFTDERPTKLPDYFAHPKYRSAYLLYFLPLQAAKFLTVFSLHGAAVEAALKEGMEKGKIVVADLGAGPGTASLAFLLWLLDQKLPAGKELPPVEFHWIDTNKGILEDGKGLAESVASAFPKLRGKVTVHTHVATWTRSTSLVPADTTLILLGNVLNEATMPTNVESVWFKLTERMSGAGMLLLEPALRRSSQLLSRLRDELLEQGAVEQDPSSIWGPCLHAGKCPLAEGRDWCHFSVPVRIPGKWFMFFSKGLGSERQWAKFSYLWIASREHRAPVAKKDLRRVVSDPLEGYRTDLDARSKSTYILCEPERSVRLALPASRKVRRGDLITKTAK